MTPDPLVSSALYNAVNSHIYILPNEILLEIIDTLIHDEDSASFFCFRQVSRRFRRLTNDRQFEEVLFCMYSKCNSCYTTSNGRCRYCWWNNGEVDCQRHIIPRFTGYPTGLKNDTASRLRRDLLCIMCQDGVQERKDAGLPIRCKFAPRDDLDWLDCSSCGLEHPSAAFSFLQRQKVNDRVCIAKEGYIRLCQHEVIWWDDIQACAGPGIRGYRELIKVCKDASHSVACCRQDSWPTATITTHEIGVSTLSLSWKPHSGPDLDPSRLDPQRYSATEVRAVAQRFRADAARFIVPESRLGHLPEMECFAGGCGCLFYDGLNKPNEANTCDRRLSAKGYVPGHGRLKRTSISVSSCWSQTPPDKMACLVFHYKSTINLRIRHAPSDKWLHALDPGSYEYSDVVGARETCTDPTCQNHYRVTTDISPHHYQRVSRPRKEILRGRAM